MLDGVTGFYMVLDCVIHDVRGCYTVLQGVTWFYTVVKGVTRCFRVLYGVTWCYRVLHGVTGCCMVLWCITRCYRVLDDITWRYTVLHGAKFPFLGSLVLSIMLLKLPSVCCPLLLLKSEHRSFVLLK